MLLNDRAQTILDNTKKGRTLDDISALKLH